MSKGMIYMWSKETSVHL
uniref:Uncharacterized protein n=1 Tax=Talaromyces marneffei PM1 TaxID=1077442 RepID=A0A093VDI3_TALMA